MKIDYTLALDTVKRSIAKLTGANFEELGLDTNVYTIGHGFDTSVLAKELEYKWERYTRLPCPRPCNINIPVI